MGVLHKHKRDAAAAAAAAAAAQARTPSPVASAISSPSDGGSGGGAKYPRFGKRGAPQAFPSKLYEILEGENPEIVGWTQTGRGFEVRDHARLSAEVLGRFFKQDKFSSFQRQLNLYGFRKITKGSEAGSYQHPHFRRGERTTLLTIRRSTKASPARVPASPSASPRTASRTDSDDMPITTSKTQSNGGAGGGRNIKPRSATPSSPPEPVARVVLPWPRQQPDTLPSLPLDVRERRGSSPDGGNSVGGGGVAPSANNTLLGGMEAGHPTGSSGDRWGHRQGGSDAGFHRDAAAAGAWAEAGAGGGGGYPNSNGSHPGNGGGWASADSNSDRRTGDSSRSWNAATAAAERGLDDSDGRSRGSSGMINAEGGRGNREGSEAGGAETATGERGTTEGLDRQDVEVVGLLQLMAQKSQDSPSRTQTATESREAAGGPTQGAAARWEGRSLPSVASRPQPFRMPRPQGGSEPRHQGEKPVTSERLYEILNRERETAVSRGPFPYGGGSDGRTGLPHQMHARMPAPFPTPVPDSGGSSSSMDDYPLAARRVGGPGSVTDSMSGGSDRISLLAQPLSTDGDFVRDNQASFENMQEEDRRAALGSSFDSNSGRGMRPGGSNTKNGNDNTFRSNNAGGGDDRSSSSFRQHVSPPSSAAFPQYTFDRQYLAHYPHPSDGVSSSVHHHLGPWHRSEDSYAPIAFSNYHATGGMSGGADGGGSNGGRVGVGMVGEWSTGGGVRPCENGRRILP